jgi:sorbitol-specific phosphotransferase system component IIBC
MYLVYIIDGDEEKGNITNMESCDCGLDSREGIPCRHILAALREFGGGPVKDWIHPRWFIKGIPQEEINEVDEEHREPPQKQLETLTVEEVIRENDITAEDERLRFSNLFHLAKRLCSIASRNTTLTRIITEEFESKIQKFDAP